MAEPISAARRAFQSRYGVELRAHVAAAGEAGLRAAYELGRDAVVGELSLLELAAAHHDALAVALAYAVEAEEVEQAAAAGRDFFLEALAAFEMVQRGVREARDAAMAERRRSAMLRQLSSLLADPSLAGGGGASVDEALRLVAEEARELTGATWCVAGASLRNRRAAEAAGPRPESRGELLLRPEGLRRRHALVAGAGDVVRLGEEELARHPAFAELRGVEGAPELKGWIAVPLTSLEGSEFGCVEAFDSEHGSFAELDEAILAHVAQLASAALERAQLHRLQR